MAKLISCILLLLCILASSVLANNNYNITFTEKSECYSTYPGFHRAYPKHCLLSSIEVSGASNQGATYVYIDMSQIETEGYQNSLAIYPQQFSAETTMFGSYQVIIEIHEGWEDSSTPRATYAFSCTGGIASSCLTYSDEAKGVKICKPPKLTKLVIDYIPDSGLNTDLSATMWFTVGDNAPVYKGENCPTWGSAHWYAITFPVLAGVAIIIVVIVVLIKRHNRRKYEHI